VRSGRLKRPADPLPSDMCTRNLAGSGLAALEQAMRVSGRPPSGMAVGSFRPHSVSLAPSAVALKRSLHLHSALTYAGLT